ncbi:MAG: response regulator [Chloroflexota bacterium]|nr:response regulator [Chloroflexota bacterium]
MNQAKTVLVVDDEDEIRGFLRLALEDKGYSVETARNGREALDKVRQDPPDAILLDLMMPTMNGWSFLATQRTLSAKYRAPVLAMSAMGGAYMARELGARGFLAKPLDLDVLYRRLHTLLA